MERGQLGSVLDDVFIVLIVVDNQGVIHLVGGFRMNRLKTFKQENKLALVHQKKPFFKNHHLEKYKCIAQTIQTERTKSCYKSFVLKK